MHIVRTQRGLLLLLSSTGHQSDGTEQENNCDKKRARIHEKIEGYRLGNRIGKELNLTIPAL